jgi:hypothetical protein
MLLNKYDRARIERLSLKISEYQRLSDDTTDPVERDRYLVLAKRVEKTRQTQRTFPGGIILWGLAVSLTLAPWSLLGHAGRKSWGILGSTIVLALLVTIRVRVRSRYK